MQKLRKWWWVAPMVPVLLIGIFVTWAESGPGPMNEALVALEPGPQVEVASDTWLVLEPAAGSPATGLIIYPGGRVDARAYAPAARAIATEGFLVVIVPMPLDLAFLGAGRAAEVIATFPDIEHWAIGGHSLGGAMAAQFAYDNPGTVDGLVLWAAYPAGNADLSNRELAVASIYGTLDGLALQEEIDASRPLLPPDTHWVAIEGGNHAQFGWYGPQPGDNPATISREAQQEQFVEATLALLQSIER
jgi:pimeloyl-ACP methyl ester carboxylesterase